MKRLLLIALLLIVGCSKPVEESTLINKDGLMAVKLWNYYNSFHDINALNILIYYNQEDTVNLEQLLYTAYNYAIQYMYVNKKEVILPKRPTLKKIVDEKTIEIMIKNLI